MSDKDPNSAPTSKSSVKSDGKESITGPKRSSQSASQSRTMKSSGAAKSSKKDTTVTQNQIKEESKESEIQNATSAEADDNENKNDNETGPGAAEAEDDNNDNPKMLQPSPTFRMYEDKGGKESERQGGDSTGSQGSQGSQSGNRGSSKQGSVMSTVTVMKAAPNNAQPSGARASAAEKSSKAPNVKTTTASTNLGEAKKSTTLNGAPPLNRNTGLPTSSQNTLGMASNTRGSLNSNISGPVVSKGGSNENIENLEGQEETVTDERESATGPAFYRAPNDDGTYAISKTTKAYEEKNPLYLSILTNGVLKSPGSKSANKGRGGPPIHSLKYQGEGYYCSFQPRVNPYKFKLEKYQEMFNEEKFMTELKRELAEKDGLVSTKDTNADGSGDNKTSDDDGNATGTAASSKKGASGTSGTTTPRLAANGSQLRHPPPAPFVCERLYKHAVDLHYTQLHRTSEYYKAEQAEIEALSKMVLTSPGSRAVNSQNDGSDTKPGGGGGSGGPSNIAEKHEAYLTKRKERLETKKQNEREYLEKFCTFKPVINEKSSMLSTSKKEEKTRMIKQQWSEKMAKMKEENERRKTLTEDDVQHLGKPMGIGAKRPEEWEKVYQKVKKVGEQVKNGEVEISMASCNRVKVVKETMFPKLKPLAATQRWKDYVRGKPIPGLETTQLREALMNSNSYFTRHCKDDLRMFNESELDEIIERGGPGFYEDDLEDLGLTENQLNEIIENSDGTLGSRASMAGKEQLQVLTKQQAKSGKFANNRYVQHRLLMKYAIENGGGENIKRTPEQWARGEHVVQGPLRLGKAKTSAWSSVSNGDGPGNDDNGSGKQRSSSANDNDVSNSRAATSVAAASHKSQKSQRSSSAGPSSMPSISLSSNNQDNMDNNNMNDIDESDTTNNNQNNIDNDIDNANKADNINNSITGSSNLKLREAPATEGARFLQEEGKERLLAKTKRFAVGSGNRAISMPSGKDFKGWRTNFISSFIKHTSYRPITPAFGSGQKRFLTDRWDTTMSKGHWGGALSSDREWVQGGNMEEKVLNQYNIALGLGSPKNAGLYNFRAAPWENLGRKGILANHASKTRRLQEKLLSYEQQKMKEVEHQKQELLKTGKASLASIRRLWEPKRGVNTDPEVSKRPSTGAVVNALTLKGGSGTGALTLNNVYDDFTGEEGKYGKINGDDPFKEKGEDSLRKRFRSVKAEDEPDNDDPHFRHQYTEEQLREYRCIWGAENHRKEWEYLPAHTRHHHYRANETVSPPGYDKIKKWMLQRLGKERFEQRMEEIKKYRAARETGEDNDGTEQDKEDLLKHAFSNYRPRRQSLSQFALPQGTAILSDNIWRQNGVHQLEQTWIPPGYLSPRQMLNFSPIPVKPIRKLLEGEGTSVQDSVFLNGNVGPMRVFEDQQNLRGMGVGCHWKKGFTGMDKLARSATDMGVINNQNNKSNGNAIAATDSDLINNNSLSDIVKKLSKNNKLSHAEVVTRLFQTKRSTRKVEDAKKRRSELAGNFAKRKAASGTKLGSSTRVTNMQGFYKKGETPIRESQKGKVVEEGDVKIIEEDGNDGNGESQKEIDLGRIVENDENGDSDYAGMNQNLENDITNVNVQSNSNTIKSTNTVRIQESSSTRKTGDSKTSNAKFRSQATPYPTKNTNLNRGMTNVSAMTRTTRNQNSLAQSISGDGNRGSSNVSTGALGAGPGEQQTGTRTSSQGAGSQTQSQKMSVTNNQNQNDQNINGEDGNADDGQVNEGNGNENDQKEE